MIKTKDLRNNSYALLRRVERQMNKEAERRYRNINLNKCYDFNLEDKRIYDGYSKEKDKLYDKYQIAKIKKIERMDKIFNENKSIKNKEGRVDNKKTMTRLFIVSKRR